ncbi:MAG TPA: sigma-70 family RNA polymerase sigma factor [Candidatus Limnocylindrales bacterium]|nr:sigma-70 family RNA polymerase sigma factor [Candidatus Limnocylindrales bacterium]
MTTVDERNEPESAERADHAMFEAFYRATVTQIFATACRYLYGKTDAANEVVQEGYTAIWRSWASRRSLSLDDNMKYLARIVYFKVVDHFRGTRFTDEFDEVVHYRSDQPAVEDSALTELGILRLVRQHLDHEPPRRRAVALMYFLDGLDVDQIAATLQMSHSTVRTHIERSRKILRRYVAKLDALAEGDRT